MKRAIWVSPKTEALEDLAEFQRKNKTKKRGLLEYFRIAIFRQVLWFHGSDVLESKGKEERLVTPGG